MMSDEITVTLSKHSFPDGSKLFLDPELKLKHRNFIFAKNGSGKSTLTDVMKEQFSDNYDVRVFQGFSSVIGENKQLNAVILGEENIEIQSKIEISETQIKHLQTEKIKLNSEQELTQQNVDRQQQVIDNFKVDSARSIKRKLGIVGNYDKRNFNSDITSAHKLESNDLQTLQKVQSEQAKANINVIPVPHINLANYLQSVNEIITATIERPTSIIGLSENPSDEKGQFARRGMELHEHIPDEICAFCGQSITNDRWELLRKYFSNEYQQLENRVQNGKNKLKQLKTQIMSIVIPARTDFYVSFENNAQNAIQNFKDVQEKYKQFIDELMISLDKKANDMTEELTPLTIDAPNDLDDVIITLNSIINKDNEYTAHLTTEKNKAKQAIRFHEVAVKLSEFNYAVEMQKLKTLEKINSNKIIEINKIKISINEKNDEKKVLVEQTQNVEIIVNKINDRLEKSGHKNIKLVFEGHDTQGIYRIENIDGKRRDIEQLSTGEKNVIAFLYFINRLSDLNDALTQLIIFDDPMNSNDDTMQYLIIMELQNLVKNIGQNYVVIMTHNTHFYLNLTYKIKNYNNKDNFYHIDHNGDGTVFNRIEKKQDDFQTNYEQLWQELAFLYLQGKPHFMLNPIRRILETYIKFNNIEPREFYKRNPESKKLFDVNSHSIDDLEADLNGKNEKQIIAILQQLFKDNSANAHFDNHWIQENS